MVVDLTTDRVPPTGPVRTPDKLPPSSLIGGRDLDRSKVDVPRTLRGLGEEDGERWTTRTSVVLEGEEVLRGQGVDRRRGTAWA